MQKYIVLISSAVVPMTSEGQPIQEVTPDMDRIEVDAGTKIRRVRDVVVRDVDLVLFEILDHQHTQRFFCIRADGIERLLYKMGDWSVKYGVYAGPTSPKDENEIDDLDSLNACYAKIDEIEGNLNGLETIWFATATGPDNETVEIRPNKK